MPNKLAIIDLLKKILKTGSYDCIRRINNRRENLNSPTYLSVFTNKISNQTKILGGGYW